MTTKSQNSISDINTFANCPYRDEEILPNDSFCGPAFKIGMTTDPGLLDWSDCSHTSCPHTNCETNLREGKCPMGFPPMRDHEDGS